MNLKFLHKTSTYRVVKDKHELLSWLTLSYLLNIALLILQMIGLMHYMYICQHWCIYFVVLDALCLFKWIVSSLPKMVGHKGSSCWVLYSRILTLKSFVIFFWVLPKKPRAKGVLIRYTGGSSIEIMLLLFITPTLYTILAYNTGVHLYGGLNMISSERLIHSDMIIHVVFDFLDIIDILHKFSIDYNSLIHTFHFYRIFCGLFLATPIFLHGYSFPCMSGASLAKASKNFKTSSANDIYFCRKFAAIVGIFFVDLPFLFIRIYSWQSRVHYSAFAPFMLKNICFFLLQITRIRHTTIGIESLRIKERSDKLPVNDISENNSGFSNNMRPSKIRRIVKKYRNEIKMVKMNEVFLKILLMINVDIKSELSHYLDSSLYFSNWFNMLLSLPQFIFSLSKFVFVLMFIRITQGDNISHAAEIMNVANLHKIFVSPDHKPFFFCFLVMLAGCGLIFLIWTILGPILDAFYLTLFTFVRFAAFIYSLIVTCYYIDTFKLFTFISLNSLGKPLHYMLIIFAFKPFMNLLVNLYPMLCVLLGKRNIYYINPSTFNLNKLKLHENLLFKKNIQDMTQYLASNDEICVVNLSSFVLFINCKEMCSTYSSYSLLVGPNLIKASRLHYGLFSYHKRKFVMTLMLRFFCMLLTAVKGGQMWLLGAVFALDLVQMGFYTLYACVQRIIAIEAMELQIIANDILKEQKKDEFSRVLNANPMDPITRDNTIYKRFKRHYKLALPTSLASLL